MAYDIYSCIGGEGWYWERCSANFLVDETRRMFSEIPPVAAPFREDVPISLGDIQGFQLSETKRKEYFENIKNLAYRSSAGTITSRNDFKFEAAHFQELSYLVHISSSYEELFIRRNAVMLFMQRILRSAQINGASLKPAYPGSSTYCTCGKVPHLEFCPLHDINDDEKEFLFPPLQPGDRVVRGPDWQWGSQGGNEEGIVLYIKDWKGVANQGVRIHWDNGEENMYRYGADCCYDVVDAYPMRKKDYQPLYGLADAAETYWSRYVNHYIKNGLYKAKGFFAPHINKNELSSMLPDYENEGNRDPEFEQQALKIVNQVIEVAEKDILDYFSNKTGNDSFKPSSRSSTAINNVLFPYQIYLFSQAAGDVEGKRCETAILQSYCSSLLSSVIRILTKALPYLYETKRVADVISALRETAIGQLLPYVVNMLYINDYAIEVISYISTDLQEVLSMWCKMMKVCTIENDIHQKKDNLMFLPVYDPKYKSTPQPVSWYLTLFYLLTVISSKIHYNTKYFQITDKTDELKHLAESYMCSGGLASAVEQKNYQFIWAVYENAENRFDELHAYLDSLIPEPLWQRKHQPIIVNLELQILAVFIHHTRLERKLEQLFNDIAMHKRDETYHIHCDDMIRSVWKNVLDMRKFLRAKKQEFATQQSLSLNVSSTHNTIHFVKRASTATADTLRQAKVKEYSLRIRTSMSSSLTAGSMIANGGTRRLMTFEDQSDDQIYIHNDSLQYDQADIYQEPKTMDEFIDELMQKLRLLMDLNHPLDLQESINHINNEEFYNLINVSEESKLGTSKKNEEKNTIPTSITALVTMSIMKYLTLIIPASVSDIRKTLENRSENALTLAHAIDDAVVMLKTIEDFPQAARLFILGLANSLINSKTLKSEDGYHRDYIHHTEGCSRSTYTTLITSWYRFGEFLKELFKRCVINLNWRLGAACLYMLLTMTTAKQPYLCGILQLPHFYSTTIINLSKWYATLTGHYDEFLISPGPFWDCLAEKTIGLDSPFFRSVLEDFQHRGNYVNSKSKVQGIFPLSLLALGNVLRLSYQLVLIDLVADHRIKSLHSAAQNHDSLFFWTLSDVSNLFIRQSTQYIAVTKWVMHDFFSFLQHEQEVMAHLTSLWQPFAHSLYSQITFSINPNTCVPVVDEKNRQGSIENDMAISSGEGLLACYVGFITFLSKTRYYTIIPFTEYGDMLWHMLEYSPRMQRLTLILFEVLFKVTNFIPSIEEHQFIAPLTCPNPLLEYPDYKDETIHRSLFIIQLLHLASHSDTCVAAVVGERASCALCCPYDIICYNWLFNTSLTLEQKREYIIAFQSEANHSTQCKMHIRPDGHGASYSTMITAEEAVYLLRVMYKAPAWKDIMNPIIEKIVETSVEVVNDETASYKWEDIIMSPSLSRSAACQEYEDQLSTRIPWLVLLTSVLKCLGSETVRLYPGCRIRIQDMIGDTSEDGLSLMRSAWRSNGNGFVIRCDRTMSEAMILLDKIDTPIMTSIYNVDVIDRCLPPVLDKEVYTVLIEALQDILVQIPITEELMAMPNPNMPYFNTAPLSLQPHLLQNVTLLLHITRTLHYTILNYNSAITAMKPAVISTLFKIAVKPVPCNVTFSSSTVRMYVNWFVEYLINTYPGSPRFLPMELQSETYNSEGERQRRNYSTGFGKEEFYDNWNDSRPAVIFDEKRMKIAKTIAGITGYDEEVCYKIYRSFQDNMEAAINYIMESKKSFIHGLADDYSHITPVGGKIDDTSVLIDLETNIRKPLLASSTISHGQLSDSVLSTVFPPFSRLQCVTQVKTEGIARASSLYGVISCVSNKELIYTPVSPTGVITAISNGKVRLSVLNVETGIVEDHLYDEQKVSVQKYRLLFHLDDIQHLRGIVGRLTEILLQLYIRELMICSLYTMQQHSDVIDTWKLNSYDIVRLMKYTYLSYTQSLQLIPASHDSSSLQNCLFKLLQIAIKQIIATSTRALTLIQAFMDGTWDDTDNNKVTLYVPPEEDRSLLDSSLISYKQTGLSYISLGNQKRDNSIYVSSLHPSFPKTKYSDKVTIPGADGLRILFDPRCYLDPEGASLTFFQDEELTQVIARFSGKASLFCPFTIRDNTVRFMYESDLNESKQWGYGFLIQPFENVNWNNDGNVSSIRCFDWNCFAYDLLIDISKEYDFKEDDFFNRTFNNLVTYLRTSGVPFKGRVVELLMRVIHSHNIHLTTHPNVSEMLHYVLHYCENIDINTIVPSQVPLLLDFLMTYSLQDRIQGVMKPDHVGDAIPPFNIATVQLDDSLYIHLIVVHLIVRCIYYHSLLPQDMCRGIIKSLHQDWTEKNYIQCIKAQRIFTSALDNDVISCFGQYATRTNQSLINGSIEDFTLTEEDKARYYTLNEMSIETIRYRLALIQFFNMHLQHCIHLIELLNTSKNTVKSVGTLITVLSNYIFPLVKEDMLEITIKQTEYCGSDAYPVIELDNRKIFSELERDDDFDVDSHSIITSQCMFAQLYHQMKHVNNDVLRAKLDGKDRIMAIKYKGEQGLDWGGLYRDTIERCVEDLFTGHIDLFIPCPNAQNEEGGNEEMLIPNPRYSDNNEAIQMYQFVGNLVGVSLRTKHLLSFELSPQIWKTIVGDEVTEDDIEAIDAGFMSTIRQIRDYSEEDGVDEFPYIFDLVFAILDSTGTEVELVPSGNQITVTFENRLKFCSLAIEARINEARAAAEAIATGVYALIPQRALSIFTWEQLERAVKGVPEISVDILKKHTVYIGWTETHEVVQRFWRVMTELTDKDRSQFLRFTWGRSKLPKSEVWPRPFKLTYKNAGDAMLPIAHTCFFQLELPQYSTDQIMKERLLVAFNYGSSGEFIIR